MVGGLAALQGVSGEAAELGETIAIVCRIAVVARTQAAPMHGAEVGNVGLYVPPVLYVWQLEVLMGTTPRPVG